MTLGILRNDYLALFRNRVLIQFMVQTQRKSNLARTMLRGAWEILEPLSQMLIYYFLVVIVFRSGGSNALIMLLTGIIHYLFMNNALINASEAITKSDQLLLQVPTEPLIFVAASYYRSLWNFGISLTLFAALYLMVGPTLTARVAFYPLILLVLLGMTWAGSILLSTLVVFFLDLKPMATIALRVGMYLAPVVYLVTFVPESVRDYYLYNPLACLFALLQWSLINEPAPPLGPIIVMVVCTCLMLLFAHYTYNRNKIYFTKVL